MTNIDEIKEQQIVSKKNIMSKIHWSLVLFHT